jgi:hypothetical protein
MSHFVTHEPRAPLGEEFAFLMNFPVPIYCPDIVFVKTKRLRSSARPMTIQADSRETL